MPKYSVWPKVISLQTAGLIFGFFPNFYMDTGKFSLLK